MLLVNEREKATIGGSIISGKSLENAAGCEEASNTRDGGRYEYNDEEAQSTSCRTGRLLIDCGEG